jgi:hypothetical protein
VSQITLGKYRDPVDCFVGFTRWVFGGLLSQDEVVVDVVDSAVLTAEGAMESAGRTSDLISFTSSSCLQLALIGRPID